MKKSILYSLILSVLLIACGGGGSDPTPTPPSPEPTNTAPSIPTLVNPTIAKLCISN